MADDSNKKEDNNAPTIQVHSETAISIDHEAPEQPAKEEDDGPLEVFNLDEKLYKKMQFLPEWLVLIFECVFVSFLFLFPAMVVYLSLDFKKYNIFQKVSGRKGINLPSEFLRWSLFTAITYSVLIFCLYIAKRLPKIMQQIFSTYQVKSTNKIRNRLGYLYALRKYVATIIFALIMLFISDVIIFNFTNTSIGANQPTPWEINIARFLFALAVATFFLMLEKLLIQIIGTRFRQQAYSDRIKDINYRVSIIRALEKAVSLNALGKGKLFGLLGDRKVSPSEESEQCGLNLSEDVGSLVSEEDSLSLAKRIFHGLCPANRQVLVPADFQPYFRENEYEQAFNVLSGYEKSDGENVPNQLDLKTMKVKVLYIFKQRTDIENSLFDHGKILSRLDAICLVITVILALILIAPFFEIDMKVYISSLFASVFAFGWLFQDTLKDIYKALVFLFAVHPFDVGDKVVIDGDTFIIQKIDLMSTTSVRWDGHVVYFPNSTLHAKVIHNVRRSHYLSEKIEFRVNARTPTDKLFALRQRLSDFLKREAKDFTGVMTMSGFDVEDETKMRVYFVVEHKDNFQESTGYHTRRTKFMVALKDNAEQLEIQYFPPA